MAILSSPSAPARPAATRLISLENATRVEGTIEILAVTQDPPSVTLAGEGEGFFVSTEDVVSTIHLRPTLTQAYPVVYTLTLAPLQEFPLAEPIGQLSQVGQSSGFLLNSATLEMYHGDMTLTETFNLALQFLNAATGQTFWVGDPTIVFEPPS